MTAEHPADVHGAVDLSALATPAADARAITDVTDATFAEVVERSVRVPVVLGLWAEVSDASRDLMTLLADVAASYSGRLDFVRCDIQRNPGIAEALQANSVPAAVAIVGGRPAPLFQGTATREQIAGIYDQIVEIAAGAAPGAPGEPPSPPPSPSRDEGLDAMERGDAATAVAAFEKALAENPKDADAKAGLAHARLLARTDGADLEARIAEASDGSIDAAFAAADAEVALGRAEQAFSRLLALVAGTAGEERERVRERLIELFEVVGTGDPRVAEARKRLASALF